MTLVIRFYREVSVEQSSAQEGGYRILLDGKSVRTPLGAPLFLPTRALAEAIAEEWRSQPGRFHPQTMTLTKLANTAIDRLAHEPDEARAQILSFAGNDLLCYRADAPAELVERQSGEWDPLLTWMAEAHGARLRTVTGVVFVSQPEEALAAVAGVLGRFDAFRLAALAFAAGALGSAVLALALAAERLTAEEAFAASQLDALYQAERWGEDALAKAARDALKKDIAAAGLFLRLVAA